MTRPLNDKGVSVIIGTLLLILITVTAAAALGLMISQMEKDTMNRQTHLAAVSSENISILNVAFYENQTDWNGWNGTINENCQNWSSARLTLSNLNINSVLIMGIAFNDYYVINYSDSSPMDPLRNIYNSSNYLTIPAESSKTIYVDFVANASNDPQGFVDYSEPCSRYFAVNTTQNIKILTSLTNFFQINEIPPNPVYQMSIESENIGTTSRDDLLLDGSGSTATNPIIWYNWTIYDEGLPQVNGAWPNQTFSGKTVRITTLNNTLNIPDPTYTPDYFGTLTVTDSTGLTQTSSPFAIPPDPQFNPPANVNIQYTDPSTVPDMFNITVRDINGNRINHVLVNFQIGNNPYNNLMIQPYTGYTDLFGNISVDVTNGNGTVNVLCGKLPSAQVSVCSNLTTPAVICPLYN
jgi:flagellin-like protein